MASKRAVTASISSLARLCLPAPSSRRAAATSILLRPRRPCISLPSVASTIRLAHSIPRPRNRSPFKEQYSSSSPTTSSSSSPSPPSPSTAETTPATEKAAQPNIRQQPHYELTFTCKPCGARSRHRVSKQGYHHGSVLIACPGCRNRHVISDHLRIFGDARVTVEDLLRARGELVKKGTLGEDGDLEFWEDGTTTVREPWEGEDETSAQEGGDDAPPGSSFRSVKPGEGKSE
ncbi:hypothetical protein VTK56DRAFT_2871 [Thermocarpiscus australiensis]